jgi:hypothetical protein
MARPGSKGMVVRTNPKDQKSFALAFGQKLGDGSNESPGNRLPSYMYDGGLITENIQYCPTD